MGAQLGFLGFLLVAGAVIYFAVRLMKKDGDL